MFLSFPLYLICCFFLGYLFSGFISVLPFSSAAPPKIAYILPSVPFHTCCCPFWALLFVFPCPLWGDGLSPSCCSFTRSVPPEAERQMNEWSEILPLIIPFCSLAPVVHPPPAAQRWSSLITRLLGSSVFEQQEGKKERSEMGQVKEDWTMGSLLMVSLFSETRFGENKA